MVSIGRTIRTGLLVFAAIGFIGGSAWAKQKAQPEQRAAAAAEQASPSPAPAPAKSLAPKMTKPYEPACSAPKDQGEKELCESIRANDLAARNLYWVRIGTGAVLLSLIFTGWAAWAAAVAAKAARKSVDHAEADATEQAERFGHQLHIATTSANAASSAARATRALAIAGQKSAGAAAKQVEIADDTARKQLRAYVGAAAVSYTYNRETSVFLASVEIKNFGQTPAINFRFLVGLDYVDFPIETHPDIGEFEGVTRTLFPTGTTKVDCKLPADEYRINHLRDGKGCYLLTVLIQYADHQGVMHVETIRYYAGRGPIADPFAETHTGPMFLWHGEST